MLEIEMIQTGTLIWMLPKEPRGLNERAIAESMSAD